MDVFVNALWTRADGAQPPVPPHASYADSSTTFACPELCSTGRRDGSPQWLATSSAHHCRE